MVSLSLGIDFGTTFTKVVWRDLGTDSSGTVILPPSNGDAAFPGSIVHVTDSDICLVPWDKKNEPVRSIRFLKMHVAGRGIGTSPDVTLDMAPNDAIAFALAAFFVARIALESRRNVVTQRADALRHRNIQWAMCLGVPDAQFDSQHKATFDALAQVSWLLSLKMEHHTFPENPEVSALMEEVHESKLRVEPDSIPTQTYPEVGAAVLSFLVSQSAQPGVYVYFDIGGGTLDGVAFRYRRDGQTRRVEFLSAQVDPLGIDAIAAGLCTKLNQPSIDVVRRSLIGGERDSGITLHLDSFKGQVQTTVATVIMKAKKADGRDWLRGEAQRELCAWLAKITASSAGNPRLIVFQGGGGVACRFYTDWIKGTHGARNHRRAGVPEYDLRDVPKPDQFLITLPADTPHGRLAVAFGLSAAITTGVAISGFPSQAVFHSVHKAQIDFDARATERYGEIV